MNDNGLVNKFMKVSKLLHRQVAFSQHKPHGGMGNTYRGQGRVLKLLSMKTDLTQKELAYLLDMRPQSLGELLNKLEDKGYISREPNPNDKRAMNVAITDLGREQINSNENEENELFSFLSAEDSNKLSEILDKIIENFKEKELDNEMFNEFHNFYNKNEDYSEEEFKRGFNKFMKQFGANDREEFKRRFKDSRKDFFDDFFNEK